jgi:hypothetical protein
LSDLAEGFISEKVAKKIVLAHQSLNFDALIGKSFDSLFKQLCGEKNIKNKAGAQVLAPFTFVSNLAGALLALELLRFCSSRSIATNYFFAGV